MSIEMKFDGLDVLIKKVESLNEMHVEKTNKKILKECGVLAHETVKPLIHKSRNNNKSGPQHKGSPRSVPPGHARDNVPGPRIRKKDGLISVVVGWEKADNSPFFYMKMEEWGTTKRPPHPSFSLVNEILKNEYNAIAKKGYVELIKKLGCGV